MIRHFINGYTVTTYLCGSVFESSVYDKYGRQVRAKTDFSKTAAMNTHEKFMCIYRG